VLKTGHAFYTMENVFLSPHVGGAIRNYEGNVIDVFATNLRRYIAGESLLNEVNWELEY
jgi:phosphoglycerate dehydrogenase-like enzyme